MVLTLAESVDKIIQYVSILIKTTEQFILMVISVFQILQTGI